MIEQSGIERPRPRPPGPRAARGRFAAGLAALAAGATGVVVVIALLRGLPPVAQTTVVAPAAAGAAVQPRTPTTADLTPPAGAAVFAGQAGQNAIGLAIQRQDGRFRLQASLMDGNGDGVSNLTVDFALAGRDERTAPTVATGCGSGCYRASLPAAGAPAGVVVTIGRRDPERVSFALPTAWPLRPAGAIVRRAEQAWRALRTLVFHDALSAGGSVTVRSVWEIVAPNRLAYAIQHGGDSIIVGARRWDRVGAGSPWQESSQLPVHQPVPSWVGFDDAYVLGSTRVGGRPAWRVSFFDPGTPGWFTILVEKTTFRTLDVHMIAAAHFMHDVYGPFDGPVTIEPPGPAR